MADSKGKAKPNLCKGTINSPKRKRPSSSAQMGNEGAKRAKPDVQVEKRLGVRPFISCTRGSTKVSMAMGSVVEFSGDCTVNAANTGCLFGGGVDGAISSAGGEALREAREKLPVLRKGVRCECGDAKMTIGGELPAKFCAHAVGPQYYSVGHDGVTELDCDTLLYSAYQSALKRAEEKQCKTVAFSLLSAGVFRAHRDLKDVLCIGLKAILDNCYEGLEEVMMVGFTKDECRQLHAIMDAFKKEGKVPAELKIDVNKIPEVFKKFIEIDRDDEDMFEEGENATLTKVADEWEGKLVKIVGYNRSKRKFRVKPHGLERIFLVLSKNLKKCEAKDVEMEDTEVKTPEKAAQKPAEQQQAAETSAAEEKSEEAKPDAVKPAEEKTAPAVPPTTDEAEEKSSDCEGAKKAEAAKPDEKTESVDAEGEKDKPAESGADTEASKEQEQAP